jgi:hypothetical protein
MNILRDCLKLHLIKMNYANSFTIYTEKYIIPFYTISSKRVGKNIFSGNSHQRRLQRRATRRKLNGHLADTKKVLE